MDFELSSEQEELRRVARALLAARCDRDRIRLAIQAPRPLNVALWKEMVDLGWLGVDVPVAAGGVGAGFIEATILFEEIGRALAPVPYLPTVLALGALRRSAQTGLVNDVLAGQRIAAAVWDDELAVSGPDADILVAASVKEVTVTTPARIQSEPAMDPTRSVGWVKTRGTRIDDGTAGEDLLDRGAIGTSALLLGGAAKVLEMATQYAKDRRQFGRPIGSFQAIKHHCANMLVDIEGMRSLVYWAAWCADEADPDTSIAASSAKAWCADAGLRVIETGMQIHGGTGFTWDNDLHLYLKRAVLDRSTFGSARFHRDRLAGKLRRRLHANVPFT
jgi:alkylation response protein AidB-like acyl-CoA dehydrogenase